MLLSKEDLRRETRRRLKALPPEQFQREGADAAACITGLPVWRRYGTVLLFVSMKDEIRTEPLIAAAWAGDKAVFVPQIQGIDLQFRRIRDAVCGFKPEDETEIFGEENLPALIFTPGLAFDRHGTRLGRGKGYYDRFLAGLDRAGGPPYFSIGLCLEDQVLPRIPADAWDHPVDALCTGEGFGLI